MSGSFRAVDRLIVPQRDFRCFRRRGLHDLVGRHFAGQPGDPKSFKMPNIAGMPFKSKAQRRKFAELLVTGKISDQTYEEWNRSTGSKTLPERIHPKVERGPKSKKRSKTKKAGPRSKARKR